MKGSSNSASIRSGIGHEVGGDVAAVELHALGVLDLEGQPLGLFDGDDTVLADLLHHIGDQAADFLVGGGDAGDLGDLVLAGHFDGGILDGGHHRLARPARGPA